MPQNLSHILHSSPLSQKNNGFVWKFHITFLSLPSVSREKSRFHALAYYFALYRKGLENFTLE